MWEGATMSEIGVCVRGAVDKFSLFVYCRLWLGVSRSWVRMCVSLLVLHFM